MTPTLGDFLTIAGQRIAAADQHPGRLNATARTEVIAELDRLLTVMARYACDGLNPSGETAVTPLVPTRQELTVIGIRLTLLHAADSIHRVAHLGGIRTSTGHPVAADLRAAADALITGRDLVGTYDPGPSHTGRDPLWAPALSARPVAAALMRQLCGYAWHLERLTARALPRARDRAVPLATRKSAQDTRKWLTLTATAYAEEPEQPGLDISALLLHSIPANLPPPRHPPADRHLHAAELCAGATATAARLRHLTLRAASQQPGPSPSAAASWRHNSLAAAVIGHNSELLLRTLAERGRQLALPEPHQHALCESADAMRIAWQSCQAVTHAWDPVTTGPSRRLSLTPAELDDLVLWIGRLARTGTWTPARAHTGQPRTPPDLARTPDDITIALVAAGRTTDAVTSILRHDLRSAEQAAAAGWLYSPARLLPESDDLRHIYRYRHASPDQLAELRAAYQHSITAAEAVTARIDGLLADLCTPGEPYALARALQRHPLGAHPQPPNTMALTSHPTAGPGLGAGDTEHLLHSLRVTDPQLLFRAIALDHATRDLTAEALAKTQLLADLTEDARHATDCRSSSRRNHSARLAAQDLLMAAGGPALARSVQNAPAGGTLPRRPDVQQQRRH